MARMRILAIILGVGFCKMHTFWDSSADCLSLTVALVQIGNHTGSGPN
eukprot:COSAG02_NODE_51409_length_314_cov_0.916279_1_plen_47_part_10